MKILVISTFLLNFALCAAVKDARKSLSYYLNYFTPRGSTRIEYVKKEKGLHLFNVYYHARMREEVLGPSNVRKRVLRTLLNEMAVEDSQKSDSKVRYLVFFHED